MKITMLVPLHHTRPISNLITTLTKQMELLECTELYSSETGELILLEELYRVNGILSSLEVVDTMKQRKENKMNFDYDRKDILDALHLISEICSCSTCDICPFRVPDTVDKCMLCHNEPDEWSIVKEEPNWCAFSPY